MKKTLLSTFAAIMIIMMSCSKETNPVLTIEGGQIQGIETTTQGVIVYKGIPFAAPPTGENRWKEPQPVVPWSGIKIADKWGAPAPQAKHTIDSFYGKEFFWEGDPEFSEDCLYLNVWTPAAGDTDKKLPVAMWVHGGGYTAGWGFEPEMDGEAWAERDVILVTINYRLGIFGFFTHPELSAESAHNVSGNYGTLDQIAAIKWIKNNIEQFGGNPDDITIFGQSAGAMSIMNLVSSPLSKNLINKAIIQSGGGVSDRPALGGNPLADAEQVGKAFMEFGGYASLAEMRAAPTDSIFNLTNRFSRATRQRPTTSPIIDGYVSEMNFSDCVKAGKVADIPYMMGFTMDDMGMLASGVDKFCLLREEQGKPAYAYQFARALPGDDAGAFHSSELWYIFHTIDRCWRPMVEADKVLSVQMVNAWTNFAKNGNPNGEGVEKWDPFTADNQKYMVFKLDEEETGLASGMGDPEPPSIQRNMPF